MFRLVPTIWILCDHIWLVTKLLTIEFGFEDVAEQNSTLKECKLVLCISLARSSDVL